MDEEYAKKIQQRTAHGQTGRDIFRSYYFISCLGLFGLATYMAEARIKEIGIRKVLGASVSNITALLSIDFVKLIIFSILIATPVAYWAMFKWLQGYPYRIGISWKVFMTAGGLALLIALTYSQLSAVRAAMQTL